MEVGQLCIKIAGRDAGRECLVVERINDITVLIDGNTRRRKCNLQHLEVLNKRADIKSGASHEEVIKALEQLGVMLAKRAPAREQKAKQAAAVPEPAKKEKLKKEKLKKTKEKKTK